jgi:hypothetical protein
LSELVTGYAERVDRLIRQEQGRHGLPALRLGQRLALHQATGRRPLAIVMVSYARGEGSPAGAVDGPWHWPPGTATLEQPESPFEVNFRRLQHWADDPQAALGHRLV